MSQGSNIGQNRAITCTFMHRFQNNFAELLPSRGRRAIRNIFSGRLKVKVTGVK